MRKADLQGHARYGSRERLALDLLFPNLDSFDTHVSGSHELHELFSAIRLSQQLKAQKRIQVRPGSQHNEFLRDPIERRL